MWSSAEDSNNSAEEGVRTERAVPREIAALALPRFFSLASSKIMKFIQAYIVYFPDTN